MSPEDDDGRPVLMTPRLCVMATPLAAAVAAADGDLGALGAIVGAGVAADWPPPFTAAEKPSLRDAIAAHPDLPGFWGGFLVVLTAPGEGEPEPLLIGHVGLKGPPNLDGAVELGYSIVGSHVGRGYATEAARAVIAWAFFHSDARAVTALVRADNHASARVLLRCGMTQRGAGTEPGVVRYAVTREEAATHEKRGRYL